jgi:hypothetical protein
MAKPTVVPATGQLYETGSLNHAAVLVGMEVPLHGYHGTDGQTVVVFEFAEPERAKATINDYMAGTLTVNARRLIDALAVCRDIVRNVRAGRG